MNKWTFLFFPSRLFLDIDRRCSQNFYNKLSVSFCALLITLVLVISKYIPSDVFLVGSNLDKYKEDSNSFFTFSFSLFLILMIGAIAIFCRNILC